MTFSCLPGLGLYLGGRYELPGLTPQLALGIAMPLVASILKIEIPIDSLFSLQNQITHVGKK